MTWGFRTGSISAAETLKQQRQGMETMGMVQLRAHGTGAVRIEACSDRQPPVHVADLALSPVPNGDLRCLALTQGEAIGLRVSATGGPASIRLDAIYAFVRPSWQLRP